MKVKKGDLVGDMLKLLMMLTVFTICIALKHGERVAMLLEGWIHK